MLNEVLATDWSVFCGIAAISSSPNPSQADESSRAFYGTPTCSRNMADRIAERIVQLGGSPAG